MRRLKGASAAFEDEPYCYVAARHPQFAELFPEAPACPDPVPGSARLLDSPRLTRAGAHYRVCSDGGEVLTRQVSGRDKEALRRIRRLDRGSLELPDESQMRD